MAQLPLITRRDLLNHGAGSEFIGDFDIRTLIVTCAVSGALGTASFYWQFSDDTNTSTPKVSQAGASWTWDAPDPSWVSVTFPAQAYTAGNAWTVATDGTVTPVAGAPAGVTSVRYDIIAAKIAEVSSKIAQWTQPRCKPPILSLGEGQKGAAAAIVIYRLKTREGMTPPDAGAGDDNIRLAATDAQRDFEAIGRSDNRPPDIVDSSTSGVGVGIPQMPVSRSPRGFGDF